jgi:outer membrane protein assembly factor BamB
MRPPNHMTFPERVVVYVGGHVVSLDPVSGTTIWKTKLPKCYKHSIGTVLMDGDIVIAGVGGYVFALNIEDGAILWQNDMPRLGHGMISIATPSAAADSAAAAAADSLSGGGDGGDGGD